MISNASTPPRLHATFKVAVLIAASLWAAPVWGISHTLKTTIHRVAGAPTGQAATTTTDQTIEWGINPSGTQNVTDVYQAWYVQRYEITSSTAATTYNPDGSSSVTYSQTGPKAAPSTMITPASAPLVIPLLKWNRTEASGASLNQTTTVELRPVATGTEDSTTYGLFMVTVGATAATGGAIPPGQITIAGETADAQGNIYLSYPLDGALRTITPTINGYTDYEFVISVQPAKLVISYGNPTPAEPIPVWVSDRIDVSVALAPPIASIDPGTYTWQVPSSQIISRFNYQNLPCGPVWWADPHTSSTTFAWVTGAGQGIIRDVIAQAKVKGKFLASKLKFSVTRPTVTPNSLFPCPDPSVGNNAVGLLGACDPENAGFRATTAFGQPALWVQLIGSAAATMGQYPNGTINRSTAGLDTRFPYTTGPSMLDEPSQPLVYPTLPTANFVSRSDSFSAFLMVARSGQDFAVPIARVDWTWYATAWKYSGIWSLGSGFKSIPISQSSSTFPVWSRKATGAELLP